MIDKQTVRNRQFTLNTVKQFKDFIGSKFTMVFSYLDTIKNTLNTLAVKTFNVKVTNQIEVPKLKDYSDNIDKVSTRIDGLLEAVKKLDKEPVKIETKEVDFSGLLDKLSLVEKAVKGISVPETKLDGVVKELKAVKKQIADIPPTYIPEQKEVKIPDTFSLSEGKEIINQLKDLQAEVKAIKLPEYRPKFDLSPLVKEIKSLQTEIKNIPKPEFPEEIAISELRTPFPMPTPVTNFNMNPLRGIVHTTTSTVSASLTQLPSYGVLDNRRSIIFYNNSNTITVYIGGSGVTIDSGIPIEPKGFSPAFDSGPLQKWYGITASSTADIRCIELQNTSGA